ncbi:MAG: PorP/SprF family type IX secretion system membrane protein, partial [Vicingaceae bacterium]
MGLIFIIAYGQDYRFSQFYNAPLVINPAMAGKHDLDYRLNTNYRNQWQSISTAYRTIAASYDMPMFENIGSISKMGFGLSFLTDKAGSTNYGFTNINGSFAYHLKTDRYTQLSAGILLGYGQSSVDLSNVRWESQHNGNNYDPSAPSGESVFAEKINYLDAGLGMIWTYFDPDYDRLFEIGLSAMHLNFPNQ